MVATLSNAKLLHVFGIQREAPSRVSWVHPRVTPGLSSLPRTTPILSSRKVAPQRPGVAPTSQPRQADAAAAIVCKRHKRRKRGPTVTRRKMWRMGTSTGSGRAAAPSSGQAAPLKAYCRAAAVLLILLASPRADANPASDALRLRAATDFYNQDNERAALIYRQAIAADP